MKNIQSHHLFLFSVFLWYFLKYRISIIQRLYLNATIILRIQTTFKIYHYIFYSSRNKCHITPSMQKKKRYEKEIDLHNQSYEKRPGILFTSFHITFSLHPSLSDKFHTYEKSLKHEYYHYVYMVSLNVDKALK